MKLDRKRRILLKVGICSFIVVAVWFMRLDRKKTHKNHYLYLSKNNASQWLGYLIIQEKLFNLNQGWKRSIPQSNFKKQLYIEIPIKDSIENQINEIKRIYEEEILGKLSEANRIYEEHQQNLYREYKIKETENNKAVKIMLEDDLASKKELQRKILQNYYQELELSKQLTLVNLELQKKLIVFNSTDSEKQQDEVEQIDFEIAIIRDDIKKKVDERRDELDKEFAIYQKQRTTDYQRELRNFRKTKRQQIEAELNRFREELIKEFMVWNEQRRSGVEEAIELRRSQQ